jgi:hypothetical protein
VAVASIFSLTQPGGYGGFSVATPSVPKERSGFACAVPTPTTATVPNTSIDSKANLRINSLSIEPRYPDFAVGSTHACI